MLLEAQQHHFSAFVVKDHYCPTMLSAYIAEKYVGDGSCRVFGGIALNNSVGGINLKAVDAAVAIGAKLVWMPTVSALRHKIMHSSKGVAFPANKGMSVAEKPIMYLQEDGSLQPQVLEVLVQVYEEITNFRFSAEGETDRTAGDFVLTYLPQGMEETVRQSSRIRHYICFEDNTGNMLEVTHIVVGANASSILGVDTEDAEVEYFKIHNSEAMAISKNLDHTIFWTEDNCYYLLSGTIPMEELKQVALGLEPIS